MRFFLLLYVGLFLLSCSSDDNEKTDCSAVTCEVTGISLELVSQDSESNLFETEILQKVDITVLSQPEGSEVNYLLTSENILLLPTGNYTNQFTPFSYDILSDGQTLFSISFESKRAPGFIACCPDDDVRSISFGSTETEKPNENVYFYKVFLDF